MKKEYKIGTVAKSWVDRFQNTQDKNAMLADISRIMCQIIDCHADEVINDKKALDMLLTLANVSSFIDSIGGLDYENN